MTLPRTYWCHIDHVGRTLPTGPLDDITTVAPGQAVDWVRECVRALSPTLDRETFHRVWGWLGNHRAVDAAVRDLRRGKPYTFILKTSVGSWSWTAYPVSVLPVIVACFNSPCPTRQSVPLRAAGEPRMTR